MVICYVSDCWRDTSAYTVWLKLPIKLYRKHVTVKSIVIIIIKHVGADRLADDRLLLHRDNNDQPPAVVYWKHCCYCTMLLWYQQH